MAEKIRVSPDRLTSGGAKISSLSEDYVSGYKRIFEDVGRMQQAWDGPDNREYQAAIDEFRPDLQALADLLKQMSEFLKGAGKQYSTTQEGAVTGARNLR